MNLSRGLSGGPAQELLACLIRVCFWSVPGQQPRGRCHQPELATSRAGQKHRFPRPSGGLDVGLSGLNSRPGHEIPVPGALRPRVGLDLVLSGSKGRKKLMNP